MSRQNSKARILIVDDDQDDYIITSEYIKHIPNTQYETEWCPKYTDAIQQMTERRYDLYFVDYRLGAKSGVDLLKAVIDKGFEEPVILLTGKGSQAVDMEAMQLGAVDYLIKTELGIEKLERSIRYALDRSATLKALRSNERKYKGIFEKTKDIIFLVDDNLNFIDINTAITPYLGYEREEVLTMNICDLVEQAQHKKFLMQSLRQRKEVDDWEVSMLTKEGERKFCTLSVLFEESIEGELYVQGIIHDITNLKKVEKTTLQAEKLAAAGRLVRTLAHEVRNPLNNITLSVEQMQQDLKEDGALLYLDIIQRNSRRISDLISELLNSSKPGDITRNELTVQAVLDDVISAAIDRLTLKRVKLQVNYPEFALRIAGDKEKLKLAMLNIVMNAVEAMEDGVGKLVISLEQVGENAIITITDNGCGISEENIGRLFEPYFTQKRNGMGLGLAFTLNILQLHKASIEVGSVLNEGTTFTVAMPLVT